VKKYRLRKQSGKCRNLAVPPERAATGVQSDLEGKLYGFIKEKRDAIAALSNLISRAKSETDLFAPPITAIPPFLAGDSFFSPGFLNVKSS
jgi:hypothetical protein